MISRPAIVVTFSLGGAPRITVEADHDEAGELTDWIDEHPRWSAFLAEAVEIVEEAA